MKTYEDGLNEAWELARKIVCRETDGGETIKWVEDTFGSVRTDLVLRNYSASEAIDAVESYEKIKVGDEVVDKNEWGIKGVVTETTERLISIVEEKGNVSRWKKENFEKTGRHFSEIEKVLKQMKENE